MSRQIDILVYGPRMTADGTEMEGYDVQEKTEGVTSKEEDELRDQANRMIVKYPRKEALITWRITSVGNRNAVFLARREKNERIRYWIYAYLMNPADFSDLLLVWPSFLANAEKLCGMELAEQDRILQEYGLKYFADFPPRQFPAPSAARKNALMFGAFACMEGKAYAIKVHLVEPLEEQARDLAWLAGKLPAAMRVKLSASGSVCGAAQNIGIGLCFMTEQGAQWLLGSGGGENADVSNYTAKNDKFEGHISQLSKRILTYAQTYLSYPDTVWEEVKQEFPFNGSADEFRKALQRRNETAKYKSVLPESQYDWEKRSVIPKWQPTAAPQQDGEFIGSKADNTPKRDDQCEGDLTASELFVLNASVETIQAGSREQEPVSKKETDDERDGAPWNIASEDQKKPDTEGPEKSTRKPDRSGRGPETAVAAEGMKKKTPGMFLRRHRILIYGLFAMAFLAICVGMLLYSLDFKLFKTLDTVNQINLSFNWTNSSPVHVLLSMVAASLATLFLVQFNGMRRKKRRSKEKKGKNPEE